MTTNPNDFLLGGGGKSASFDNIGDSVTGTITAEPEVRQQTNLQTGKPETWDNGDPKHQLVVTLQTAERADSDDDGIRNIYIKGSKKAGTKSLHDAVATAVRASGADGLAKGGTLTVTFIGEEPSQTRGFNPRKLYEAKYVPPAPGAASGEYLGTAQAAAQPAQADAPAQDDNGKNIDTARELIKVGQPDQVIQQVTGLDLAVIAALRNTAA